MEHMTTEAELAEEWNPPDDDGWEPDGLDQSINWLPSDAWLDHQAEQFEAKGSDLADYVASMIRDLASEFRALDAHTLDEYLARAEIMTKNAA